MKRRCFRKCFSSYLLYIFIYIFKNILPWCPVSIYFKIKQDRALMHRFLLKSTLQLSKPHLRFTQPQSTSHQSDVVALKLASSKVY